ncbi:UNVERIFIED_CONTAM: homocitrate synthase NifV [Acetivibrio alkalicellulosi]
MSVNLKNNRVRIVDRTLPEIFANKSSLKRLESIYFCWLLKDMGVDYFEINRAILDVIGKLPVGLDFIYRIENIEDINRCIKEGVKRCIVGFDILNQNYLMDVLKTHNINTTLEYPIYELEDFNSIKQLKDNACIEMIDTIRVVGLDRFITPEWVDKTMSIGRELNININICPEDTYSEGTALCLEGILNGMDSITVSFTGYGTKSGFAALEEVLVALNVLINKENKLNLSKLAQITDYYSKITGKIIPENKPVIGKGIFKYQAGIHADGIEKNSNTYELYHPCAVGQNRSLTIGKHSGKRAVHKKLKELGIKCRVEEAEGILDNIREKSIEHKRDLFDHEIIDIYVTCNMYCRGGCL